MNPLESVYTVIDALEQLNVPYMVVGSFSCNYYAVPRSTNDADFVVQLDDVSVGQIAAVLTPHFTLDPQISLETITATIRYVLSAKQTSFRVEFFELKEDDPHHQSRFARRVRVQFGDRQAWLPSPEDVLVQKLRWGGSAQRSKDIDDARNLIAVQGDQLDWEYIHRWCDQHGSRDLLERLRSEIPPEASANQ